MSKLHSGQKLIKALERAEFHVVSIKGSHVKLRGLRSGKIHTVIVPKHKEVALGTMRSVLKQAGMELEELKEYL
jgi:predicted RNA binding protein YcfA (HicA-like mRNA interferase family)